MPYYIPQMKKAIDLTITRVHQAIYTPVAELRIVAWVTPAPMGREIPFASRKNGEKKLLKVGERWGNPGDYAWFEFSGEVPRAAAGKKIVLLVDLGGEGLVFDDHGHPVQGLTNRHSEFDRSLGEPGKRVVEITHQARGGEKILLWVQATTNDLFGKYRDCGKVQEASVAVCDDRMKQLYYNLEFLNDFVQHLPDGDIRAESVLFRLYDATSLLNVLTPQTMAHAEKILDQELSQKGGTPTLTVSALGNSHIDLAWLWPWEETVQKGARTFSTALMMMERYPDYRFGASQPQLYQWIKTAYPELYQRIGRRVEEGRWEPLGALWVESDTNLPGGESLVRQMLYGKRFFKQEFNREMRIVWLPDSFGFSGALPQIAKKAGVDYFCTTKLSWNLYNHFPHHTFIWQGIDGSRLLAHMPPEGTYNSSAAPRAVIAAEQNYIDKGVSNQILMLFGIGDGGGGPGEEHLEWLKRERNFDCMAPVVEQSALEFFRMLERDQFRYRLWDGELYLERHQGTYTTQARTKWYNRKLELALRDLEFWASFARMFTGEPYPDAAIEPIWKEVLFYQFHDILAGSAIHRVYQEALVRYESLWREVVSLLNRAWESLAGFIDTTGFVKPLLILNSTSWERQEWIKFREQWYFVRVPSMGYTLVDTAYPAILPAAGVMAESRILENDRIRVEFAADGSITAIYDKENDRSVLAPGSCANRLAVYEDDGDAWDIPIGYADRVPEFFQLSQSVHCTDGPKGWIKQTYTYGKSFLEQEISLTHGSRRLDFVTRVDWRERRKMLRTAFTVNVRNTETTCEIQFGSIRRPNTRNTTWEMAKYEVCAHKWIDLSDEGYGVALLNDCKYGHKVYENILDINLLRSPSYPDPEADAGLHEFAYSLFPHQGNHLAGHVARAGYELNIPLNLLALAATSGKLPNCYRLIEVTAENVIIETVKWAEDEPAMIIRLYESGGKATKTGVRIYAQICSIELVDLMENRCDQSKLVNGTELSFNAFEIHTLKVRFE